MINFIWKILFLVSAFCIIKSCQLTCPAKLITDLNQKFCTDKASNETAYYLDRGSCIPKCSLYPKEVQSGDCNADPNACITGYNCESRCYPSQYITYTCVSDQDCITQTGKRSSCNKQCVLPDVEDGDDSVPCMAYHSNLPNYVDKWWTAKKFKPVCDDEGNWEPKQCKGGRQGRCLCYSSTGIRLFGQALYTEAENMTCACSRKKSDMESSGRNYVSLHCDSMGNYENLQCDMEKQVCWCADPKTGELTAPVMPSAAMKKLPCYQEDKVGSQYLRQCESKKFATAMITAKLKTHGVVMVETDTLLCDADGSYGAYTIKSGIAYCTWRNNTQIGAWQGGLSEMKDKLTCNCARDFYMYAHSQTCEGTGNYVLLQQTTDANGNKKYYCVDVDGFVKSDLLDDGATNCTKFY